MIWTIIGFNHTTEQVECEIMYAPIDSNNAHEAAANQTSNIIIALIKGNHKEATYFSPKKFSVKRTENFIF